MERLKIILGNYATVVVFFAVWLVKIAAHESDPLKIILAVVYPPENSFGGTAVQMRPIPNPSKPGAVQPISLLLIEHEKSGLQDIDVMSADVNGTEQIAAGTPGNTPPRMLPGNDPAVGSAIILKASLPPQTLLGVAVTDNNGRQDQIRQRFSYRAGDTVKTFAEDGELIVRTKNGQADTTFFLFGFAALAGWCAGHALARMPRLLFPGEKESSKSKLP
jgi:hypothetical protein